MARSVEIVVTYVFYKLFIYLYLLNLTLLVLNDFELFIKKYRKTYTF